MQTEYLYVFVVHSCSTISTISRPTSGRVAHNAIAVATAFAHSAFGYFATNIAYYFNA
jgi:hypothetical protein